VNDLFAYISVLLADTKSQKKSSFTKLFVSVKRVTVSVLYLKDQMELFCNIHQ